MTEIVSKDAIEQRDSKPIKNRSRFNNSYRLAGTYRFGEYAPTMVIDCVPSDHHTIKVSHNVKSYTMKQPLMQDIQVKDDTFLIPLSAIIPRNYEKFITIPNLGDDVNVNVGTSLRGFPNLLYYAFDNLLESITKTEINEEEEEVYVYSDAKRSEFALKYIALLDTYLSSGSLLNALGMPLVANSEYVDKKINQMMSYWASLGSSDDFKAIVQIDGETYYIEPELTSVSGNSGILSFREFWNRIHDTSNWSFTSITDNDQVVENFFENADGFALADIDNILVRDSTSYYDLARFYAYQISCAHFYSNDKVDYIYSAELWRQNLRSLILNITTLYGNDEIYNHFDFNGVQCFYDECSAYLVDATYHAILTQLSDLSSSPDVDSLTAVLNSLCDFTFYIFGYRRSLRFVDYFTGSRTRPLAPGDSDVLVSGGAIDVVDVIQKKWYVRLWSQVSRVGHKLSEQMRGLFPDAKPSIDWHEPIWLHHNDGKIFASEVDNTGSNQFDKDTPIAVTSTLHGGSNGNTLNITINDRYAIVMTISYFDISRFYSRGLDRDILHASRYDKFNEFLQFMGDQKVYLKELNTDANAGDVFSYQGRYMEYKTRLDRAFGGLSNPFVLPAMVFLADYGRAFEDFEHLKPDYIRSFPCELDRFFIALSGFSLGTYFHFIMVSNDEIDSSRPMAYNPQIL